jgi:hypothetical protein
LSEGGRVLLTPRQLILDFDQLTPLAGITFRFAENANIKAAWWLRWHLFSPQYCRKRTVGVRPFSADFVAEVGYEIGASVDDHPILPLAPMGAAASTHWH